MTEKVFCYHCRVHHPPEVMGRYETRKGVRWRCLRTIGAAQAAVEVRDAFGQAQSAANRTDSQRIALRTNRLRLYSAPGN